MTRRRRAWIAVVVAGAALVAAFLTRGMGFTSRATPSSWEARTLRAARWWATPAEIVNRANPVERTPKVLRDAMEHWADHCALCHDNDGSGRTAEVKGLYPPAPDMRSGPTQRFTDGELFYVIERGIPLTGMPAWGTGTPEGERASWALVHFIRYLPDLTEDEIAEMEKLNPKSAAEIEMERQMEEFLKGPGRGGR